MLDAGHSAAHIASSTGHGVGTIFMLCSKHHSHLSKPVGGHPSILSSTNIHHAVHLISSGKASTAVDVTKTLSNIINQPLCPNCAQQPEESWYEGCGEEEEATSLTQA